MKYFLGISNFLEEISGLFHSIVFLYFALIIEECFLISLCYSLNPAFSWVYLSLAFHFFTQLFVRPPQTTILPFSISFPWGWSWSLPPVHCHEPLSIVLQAFCVSDPIPWIYLSLSFYNCKGFDLGNTHSSVLAWRIPGSGEPGGLPSMGLHRVGHDWSYLAAAAAAYLNGLVAFPNFFILSLNLDLRCSWCEPQSDPGLVSAECIELLHLCLQRI